MGNAPDIEGDVDATVAVDLEAELIWLAFEFDGGNGTVARVKLAMSAAESAKLRDQLVGAEDDIRAARNGGAEVGV